MAPASTLTTTSSVASSVIRSPSTWRLLDAGRLQRRVDLLAAAVDDDERPAAACDRAAMAATTVCSRAAIFEQFAAELQNERAGHSRPAVSGSPSITFMFCTA